LQQLYNVHVLWVGTGQALCKFLSKPKEAWWVSKHWSAHPLPNHLRITYCELVELYSEAEFLDEIQTKFSLLVTVNTKALNWGFYFFKFTQPFTVSTVQLLYTLKKKGGKPYRKPYPLPHGLRNPYRSCRNSD
jgi:hypothetical protein